MCSLTKWLAMLVSAKEKREVGISIILPCTRDREYRRDRKRKDSKKQVKGSERAREREREKEIISQEHYG